MIADAHDHYILPQLPLSARHPGHFSLLPMLPHFCIPRHPEPVGGCKETLLNYHPITENKSL